MRIHVERLDGAFALDPHPEFEDGTGGEKLVRYPGWHGKEIIMSIASMTGIRKHGTEYDPAAAFEWNWQVRMGFAWEEYMARRLPTIWQPGELVIRTGLTGKSKDGRSLDKIAVNLDGITHGKKWYDGRDVYRINEEFKYTSKSAARDPYEAWEWHAQMKLYLAALDEVYDDDPPHRFSRLWGMFARGDYKAEMSCAECWWIEYEDQEVESMRAVVVDWLKQQKVEEKRKRKVA